MSATSATKKTEELPEGVEVATLAMIQECSRKRVLLPRLTALRGHPVELTIRPISRSEWIACTPQPPPGSREWSTEEWDAKAAEWFAGLSDEARFERLRTQALTDPKILALAAVEPALTVEEARKLGDDVAVAAEEVVVFSGLVKR